jgi:hypothetical protein
MNLPGGPATSASQQLEKKRSIVIIVDDGLPPITSAKHMIDRAWVLDSEGTSYCSTV